jgi:peptidoglycan/LPS O-acetylase OafA/YrhL
MTSRREISHYRPDIDGLRCIAISTVVLSHSGLAWFKGGYIGVDVFFVISGYLITQILWAGLDNYPRSIVTFYERRARRILPALMAATTVTLIAGAYALGPRPFEGLAQSAIATTLFVSNVWFSNLSGDYFAADVRLEPLLHTWSLAVEEQFYIGFPLMLALTARISRRLILPLIVGICIVSFALSVHALATGRMQAAFYLLQNRAWELGIGAVLALSRFRVPMRGVVVEAIALLAAAAILIPAVLYDEETPFPGLAAVLPCFGTAVLIWLNRDTNNLVKSALSMPPVVFIGLISYSLYLWHWPIIVYDKILHGDVTLLRSFVCIGLSVAAGTASWYVVERPFRKPTGLLRSRRAAFAASSASAVAVTALAAAIWLGDGFPGRLAADAARAFAAADDIDPLTTRCRGSAAIGSEACRIGGISAGRPADFLLWGDSQAGAVLPGVEQAAERAGKNGFVASMDACAPLLHVDRLDRGPGHHCAAFNDAVLDFLKGRDDIPVVMLAARWALVAEGTRPEKGAHALLIHRTIALPSGRIEDNFPVFEAGIRELVAAIRATGRRVVLVGSVPEIGWSVPDRLGANLMHGLPLPDAPSADDVERRNERVLRTFAELAAAPGVDFVPLTARFCTPACAVVDSESRPVYVDDDHLTRTAATIYLASLLTEEISN